MGTKIKEDKKIDQIYYELFERTYPKSSLGAVLEVCSNVSSLSLLSQRSKMLASNAAAVATQNLDKDIKTQDEETSKWQKIMRDSEAIVKEEVETVKQNIKNMEKDSMFRKSEPTMIEAAATTKHRDDLALEMSSKSAEHSQSLLGEAKSIAGGVRDYLELKTDEVKNLFVSKPGKKTLDERIEFLSNIERRDLTEIGSQSETCSQRVEEIRDMLREESASSPSKFAPCFQHFSRFHNPKYLSGQDIELVNVANNLFSAENCWFNYMLALQQCQNDKNNYGTCYAKFKPKEFYCISQSKEGLRSLKDIVYKDDK